MANDKLLAALEASEQQRQIAQDELARFWTLSDEFIARIDAQGALLSANPAAHKLVDGQPLVARIHDQDRPAFLDALDQACKERQTKKFDSRIQTQDGFRHFRWSTACDGEADILFIIGHDISELLERQSRNRAEESRLAQVQKMEMLGELASGVAHDFNNLLVPIVTVLDIVQRRPSGDPEFDQLAAGAAKAADKARAMVRRILDFSKNQNQPAKRHVLPSLLVEVQRLARQMLPDTIELVATADETLPELWLPPQQLEVTLINLILNARDAMPDGGTIKLTASRHSTDDYAPDQDQEIVEIQVTDQGCGMDADTLSRATQRFFTTKTRDRGTGLGLYMAQRFAEQCSGRLHIDSEVGVGTKIALHLPVGEQTLLKRRPTRKR